MTTQVGRSERNLNGRDATVFLLVLAVALVNGTGARAQVRISEDQFKAVRQMIIVGVQQGISSLPPTSGQSLTYEFDPELSTFVAGEQLGPTSFRSTQTIGQGKWALRSSYSYFFLEEDFDPIKYAIEFEDPINIPGIGDVTPAGISEFGLEAAASVNLINVGFSYGITNRLEMTFNVPISIVNARGSLISTVMQGQENVPADMVQAAGVFQLQPFSEDPAQREEEIELAGEEFDACLGRGGECTSGGLLAQRSDSFTDLGFTQFNDDSELGVGRISVGGKFLFLTTRYLLMAFSTEFFNPSPSEDAYAGSASPAILPRLVAQIPLHRYFRLHMDAGYDYDFSEAELRRFVWNGGASVPLSRWVTFDFGAGGSIFDVPIRWTPSQVAGTGPTGQRILETALGNNEVGDEFIDFLGGFKVRLTDSIFLSGSATTPLNSQGFRADAVGTVAIEAYY